MVARPVLGGGLGEGGMMEPTDSNAQKLSQKSFPTVQASNLMYLDTSRAQFRLIVCILVHLSTSRLSSGGRGWLIWFDRRRFCCFPLEQYNTVAHLGSCWVTLPHLGHILSHLGLSFLILGSFWFLLEDPSLFWDHFWLLSSS